MKDYNELKRLAAAATAGPWAHGGTWVSTSRGNSIADCQRGDEKFIAAANPAAVLELLAELENLRGCDKAYAEVWEKARALQSEMDEVRQDAARYRFAKREGIYLSDWDDENIDTAMQQETK